MAGSRVLPTLPDPAPAPPRGYLDAVAGQPLLPVARAAWLAAVEQGWSDPARLHHEGRRAALLLEASRAGLAAQLGVPTANVAFTSSGPTAVAAAVGGLLRDRPSRRVVVGAVETMAVQEPVRAMADEVEVVPVDGEGRIQLEDLAAQLTQPAALVCIQAANPEVGTRQPLAEAADIASRAGVPLLLHAVQVLGRTAVPDHWDVLVASARDWGGPAGVGIIAVRPSARWRPDASPDRGWVGGFPDIPGAASAATALDYLAPHVDAEAERLHALIGRLRDELPRRVDGLHLTGSADDRLPHILTITVDGLVGEALVSELDRRGLQVASGSACTTDVRLASQVLAAMGVSSEASVRISLPLGCAEESVDSLLHELPLAVRELRGVI